MSKLEYTCFVCGAPLIPNKGDIYRHHFKHKGERACTDSWQGTYCDSKWHTSWQERYPLVNRERVLELGFTRHRADVLVGETVVEFQHSMLGKVSFDDRNAFYGDLGYKVVWLFDLREAYGRGEIVPKPIQGSDPVALPEWFVWHNPRQAFNAYDPLRGDVDLLFQLLDEDHGKCIVRVCESCETGFEEFRVSSWLTTEEFLAHTGLDDRGCPEPNLAPLEPNPDYVRFRERYGVRLDSQQERAAQTVDGSTLLLAVPGSGKTTTMVARLGYLTVERGVDPRSIIAVTYGRDAANEMRTRFAGQFRDETIANGITFSTINAFCLKIYREWCGKNPEARPERKLDEGFAKKLLRDTYKGFKREYVSEGELTDLETRVGWVKNSMREPSELPWLDEDMPFFTETYERYCQGLRDARKMDFDDQLRFAKYALEHDDELLAKYRARYRYWCVDEAQDTSRIQHQIIHMLAGPEGSGNVFMVGDEDQSIYGYRGAYPKALLNFAFDYPNARTLRMETNYRSGDEIVHAARTFVSGCRGRIDKRMVSGRGSGSVVRVEEVGHRLDQFEATLGLIRGYQREGEGTLAVLYRNNETAVPLVDQLIREDIAFTLSGNANTFFTSPTVADVKAFMKLALDPTNEKSFMRVYAKGSASVVTSKDATWACKNAKRNKTSILDEFVKQMGAFRKGWQIERDVPKAERFVSLVRALVGLSPLEAIEHLLENGYGEWLEEHNKGTRSIELLKSIASREQTLSSFLSRLDFLSGSWDKKRPNHRVSDALTLATTHSCKGREFDRVIIIDAIEDIFPSSRRDPYDYGKDEARDWQEERRLFYVAMTRAKDELILLRPADEQAPFVDEVRPRLLLAPEIAPTFATTPGLKLAPESSPAQSPLSVPESACPSRTQPPDSTSSSASASKPAACATDAPSLTSTPKSSRTLAATLPPVPAQPSVCAQAPTETAPAFADASESEYPLDAPSLVPALYPACDLDVPLPVPTPKTARASDAPTPTPVSPPAPAPTSERSTDDQGGARHDGAPTIQSSWEMDSAPRLTASPYDVDTWEALIDHGPSYRRVEYGGMQAEVTSGPAGKTVDLLAPWTDDQIRDLAEHLGEYARGCSEVAVHLDVTGAQGVGDVCPHVVGVNVVALSLKDASHFEALGRLMHELGALGVAHSILLLDCQVPGAPSGKRQVLGVDGESRRVLVSADLYNE